MKRVRAGIVALSAVVVPLFLQHQVRAENYLGIGYGFTVNDVKAMFPSAEFEELQPASAKPGYKFLSITGYGIIGSIKVVFADTRPSYARLPNKKVAKFASTLPDNHGYEVQRVRWVPDSPIPISRLKSKFGPKVKFTIDDSDFSTNATWESQAVVANLTDDKRHALYVDFNFTEAERMQGFGRRLLAIRKAFETSKAASASNPLDQVDEQPTSSASLR